MTYCEDCTAVEQGYKKLIEDGEETHVCAVCESEEIFEVNEDNPMEDR